MLRVPASPPARTFGRSALYVSEGDSITAGNNSGTGPGYPNLYGALPSPIGFFTNAALAGATLSGNAGNSLNSRAAADDARIAANPGGGRFVLSVLIGRNDLDGYSGGTTQYLTDLATYLDARRTAGWKVVICTILPSASASFNTVRNVANTTIATWAGVHADAVCDFAADATMGPDAAASDTSLYFDGTHPTALGQSLLQTVIRPALNSLAVP